MTSPRQRKKRLRALLAKQKQEQEQKEVEQKTTVQTVAVAVVPPSVVDSGSSMKAKKVKNALVETKPQDQVVEQTKEEVKTSTGE